MFSTQRKNEYLSQLMDTLITLVQSLHIINIKMIDTEQPINMPNYYMSFKKFKYS